LRKQERFAQAAVLVLLRLGLLTVCATLEIARESVRCKHHKHACTEPVVNAGGFAKRIALLFFCKSS